MFSILKDELIQTFAVFSVIWSFLYAYIYLWLPLLLGAIFTKVWLDYLRADFIFSQEYFLIEIKIPREIMKTPLAMETFLHALWQKPASTYI